MTDFVLRFAGVFLVGAFFSYLLSYATRRAHDEEFEKPLLDALHLRRDRSSWRRHLVGGVRWIVRFASHSCYSVCFRI